MFQLPEALPIHTLSKLHYLIHELNLTNHPSFPELLNCGTHCHPLLSLNPTICHLLNLTSTTLILSPFLLKLPLIFSVFPLSGLCYRAYGLSPAFLTKKQKKRNLSSLLSCMPKWLSLVTPQSGPSQPKNLRRLLVKHLPPRASPMASGLIAITYYFSESLLIPPKYSLSQLLDTPE